MSEGAPNLSLGWQGLERKKKLHNQLCYTYRSAWGGQTRTQTKKLKSPISQYHYVQGLGKSLQVNTCAAEAPWGRTGDLIKQTYCVWADGSMWLPPDAMHFHSGTGCCTTQSGPGAEVKLFASSAAETKEQWERQSEHSERTYYQPRGTQLRDIKESFGFWADLYAVEYVE